jgi:tryptophan synthase beta chain
MKPSEVIVVNVSGRGDKDLFTIAKSFAPEKFRDFLKRELESYDK